MSDCDKPGQFFGPNAGECYFSLTPHVEADYYPVRPMTQRPIHFRRLCRYGSLAAVISIGALSLLPRADGQHPKRHEQYKHQVEKLEEVWRNAQLSGDVSAIEQLLSDDYVGITMSGQVVTKDQQLDRMRKRTLMLSRYDLTDRKVKLIGSTAIVTSLANIEGNNEGQPIHGTFRSTRVYTRGASGTWKVTNFEATRVGPAPSPAGRLNGSRESPTGP